MTATGRTTTVAAKVSTTTADALAARAEADGVPRSSVIAAALEAYLGTATAPPEPAQPSVTAPKARKAAKARKAPPKPQTATKRAAPVPPARDGCPHPKSAREVKPYGAVCGACGKLNP